MIDRLEMCRPLRVLQRSFVLVLACLAHATGFAALGPTSDIYVEDSGSFEFTEFVLAGSATDDAGIASVTVAIKDQSSGQWLQTDGSWAAQASRLGTDLSSPGAPATRWLFRQSLPVGDYLVNAEALNVVGVSQDPGSRITRLFGIVADRADLNAGSRWLTIHFGRTIWGVAGGDGICDPYSHPVNGTVFLDEVAAFLTDHGYTAQGSVPFGQFDPDPNVRLCPWRGLVSASLNDLNMLRDVHGWTFVGDSIGPLPSNPSDRPNIESLTCDDQITTTAASLAELLRLGHRRAWGLFADPGNSVTTEVKDANTSRLYSFTRKYGNNLAQNEITLAKAQSGDWARYKSVNGGRCNISGAACFDHNIDAGSDGHYEMPDDLYPFLVAAPGTWRGMQFYRFAQGVNLPPGYPGSPGSPAGTSRESYWDCSSPDPARHWTSRDEIYCYNDFVYMFERLYSEHPDVITTDAAHVATTWNIGNPNHWALFPSCGANGMPVASAVSIGGVAEVGHTLTGSYTYNDAENDPEGASIFRWLRNGTTAIAGATTLNYNPVLADVGVTLTFEVTPMSQSGAPSGYPVRSAATAAIGASNQNPTVDITSPTEGANYSAGATVALTATTFDPDGHTVTVSWTANGNPIAAPWTPAAGAYAVTATADDGHGGSAIDSTNITVTGGGGNQNPTVDITSPVNGQGYATGATVALTASDFDPDGDTVTVSWTANGSPIAAPWAPADGAYSVVATADDGHGGTAADSVNITVGTAPPDVLPATVIATGANLSLAPFLVDVAGGTQDLSTSWVNDGQNSTAWFTLDLGADRIVERLRVAPRGDLKQNLTVTISDTLAGGKASGAADGVCSIAKGTTLVPTTLKICQVGGTGRYITVQGDRPSLRFHGVEVVGTTSSAPNVLPAVVQSVGANALSAPNILDTVGGVQNLATSWVSSGQNSTAWFTLDLGAERIVEQLRVAPRGDLKHNLTVTISNTLAGGKASGAPNGICTVLKGATPVPTTLKSCQIGGTGRYITIQGDRPSLRFHGIEAWGTTSNPLAVLPATLEGVGANVALAPNILDAAGGVQDLATAWSNDGLAATAWFTLDLGTSYPVGELRIAPRGDRDYTLAVTIGNSLSQGKAAGPAAGFCLVAAGVAPVPTSFQSCELAGLGRYVTVQENTRDWLTFHGVEVLAGP